MILQHSQYISRRTAEVNFRLKLCLPFHTIHRTLERQELAREAALKAFHDNIAQRAAVAGAIAVAGNKARQEREERLMAASEARAKAEAEVRGSPYVVENQFTS
jgi:hypothetical protein